jgi:hypothetical protein
MRGTLAHAESSRTSLESPQGRRERAAPRAWPRAVLDACSGMLLGALSVLLLECLGIVHRGGPVELHFSDFVAFGVGVVGATAAVLMPPLLVRAAITSALPAGSLPWLLLGTTEGLLLFWFACYLGMPRLSGTAQGLALVAAVLVGQAMRLVTQGSVRLTRLAALGALTTGSLCAQLLHWNSWPIVHVTANALVIASVAHLVRPVLPAHGMGHGVAALVLIGACTASAPLLLRESEGGRRLLYHLSPHSRGVLRLAGMAVDSDHDLATNLPGAHDCDPNDPLSFPGASELPGDGVDQNCEGGDGVPGTTPDGSTHRPPVVAHRARDVLLLSLDALRWDLVSELPKLREALGPHVELSRAVSPAPRTIHALASMLRGRALRQVRLQARADAEGGVVELDPWPTLGEVLSRHGVRAVFVPTHRYLRPEAGVTRGFEILMPRGFERVGSPAILPFTPRPIVEARIALSVLAHAIRTTSRPLAAWVHLMETHEPYRWGSGGQYGPPTLDGQRRAVRALDRPLAQLVRDFRTTRGSRSVVIVFGDHGEEFGEHRGRYHSSSVYAEQVRVTLLLAAPGLPAGQQDAPVSLASVTPTVLELLGITPPPSMTAPSLASALAGSSAWPTLAVSELRFAGLTRVGYTGPRYRYIHDPVHRIEELYDSQRDPLEQRDLAPRRPGELAHMRKLAREWDEGH